MSKSQASHIQHPTSNKERITAIVKFLTCAILLVIAYLPSMKWMIDRWLAAESYYGHGFLIPIVSLFFVWQRKGALKRAVISTDYRALWIIAGALLGNIVCASLKVYFISGFLFVAAFYGLVLFFFGKKITRLLLFPILFLLCMVPLPLVAIGTLTVKLKLFAAQCAAFILNHIGFPSMRDGSIIRMPNSFILVEAPCSGLRSLISLLTLGLIFAYMMKASLIKKAILLLSAVPIAVATNVMRILILAVANDLYGEKIAMGFLHDFSGFLVFAVAFICLMGVSKTLEPGNEE